MDWTAIIIAIVGAFGAGGLGAAVVGWIADREGKKADAVAKLSAVYEKRLGALSDRADSLEKKVERLEGIIDGLKLEVDKRENMIEALQNENKQLKADNECKDKKIAKLQSQVRELQRKVTDLTARLDAMNGADDG